MQTERSNSIGGLSRSRSASRGSRSERRLCDECDSQPSLPFSSTSTSTNTTSTTTNTTPITTNTTRESLDGSLPRKFSSLDRSKLPAIGETKSKNDSNTVNGGGPTRFSRATLSDESKSKEGHKQGNCPDPPSLNGKTCESPGESEVQPYRKRSTRVRSKAATASSSSPRLVKKKRRSPQSGRRRTRTTSGRSSQKSSARTNEEDVPERFPLLRRQQQESQKTSRIPRTHPPSSRETQQSARPHRRENSSNRRPHNSSSRISTEVRGQRPRKSQSNLKSRTQSNLKKPPNHSDLNHRRSKPSVYPTVQPDPPHKHQQTILDGIATKDEAHVIQSPSLSPHETDPNKSVPRQEEKSEGFKSMPFERPGSVSHQKQQMQHNGELDDHDISSIRKIPSIAVSELSCETSESLPTACTEERIIAKMYDNGRPHLDPSAMANADIEAPSHAAVGDREEKEGEWKIARIGGEEMGTTAQEGVLLSNESRDVLLQDKKDKLRQQKEYLYSLDERSRTDSLTTVPNPPSLAERSYVRMPGAFRMSSDGYGPVRPQPDADTVCSNRSSINQQPHHVITVASLVNETEADVGDDSEVPPPPGNAHYRVSGGEATYTTTVTTSSPIVEGTPIDEGHTCRLFFKNKKVQCGICLLLALFAVLVIGTVYGVTEFENIRKISPSPSASPVATDIEETTMTPTASPTSPGDLDLEYFVNVALPDYSRDALNTANSDQYRAFDWLRSDKQLLASYPLFRRLQRFALATLYYSTWSSRRQWNDTAGWLSDDHECNWFTTANESSVCVDEEYSTLSLVRNKLLGTIPEEISLLTSLMSIDLRINGLTGFLPSSIGECTNLRELRLENNYLTGPIPNEIGRLTDLEVLDLAYSNLAQVLPASLGLLENLQELRLDRNLFVGTVPSSLGRLTRLREISLNSNYLSGKVPTEIGLLTELESLMMGANYIAGTIRTELLSLSNLKILSLSYNYISGEIPTKIGLLRNVEILDFGNNTLHGSIPTEIGNLEAVTYLDFFRNYLKGPIPSEIGRLSNLATIALEHNKFTGTIPVEISDLRNMTGLWMFSNFITGTIPSEIGYLTNMEEFSFSRNMLTGSLPTELGTLSSIELLSLASNFLTGKIPSELGLLTKLTRMELHANMFTGIVPEEVCALVVSGQISQENFILDCSTIQCTCCKCTNKVQT